MYQKRMLGYYPTVIQSILEFQAIIQAEYPEIKNLHDSREDVLSNAYLSTMSETRIEQWEKLLNIKPLSGSTVSDRRETIISRIRGQGKLNTDLIKSIVKTFTGGDCRTWIEDSTLFIGLLPSGNKEYILDNLVQEIKIKLPAHLNCNILKTWQTWGDITSKYANWEAVRQIYGTWEDVLYDLQDKPNQLDYSTLDSLHLG